MQDIRLETIVYQTVKGGPQMRGLLVNEGDGPVLDEKGAAVPEVWDYRRDNRFIVEVTLGATGA